MELEKNIKLYEKQLINYKDLKAKRRTGKIKYEDFSIDVIKKIVDDANLFCYDDHTYALHNIKHSENEMTEWNVENAILQENVLSKEITYLYNSYPRPAYILIIYTSTIGEDFDGGEHVFLDDTVITPIQYSYVMYDAKEVYKINPVKNGVRNSIKLVFY